MRLYLVFWVQFLPPPRYKRDLASKMMKELERLSYEEKVGELGLLRGYLTSVHKYLSG